jgi:hypothetical protein
MMEDGRGKMEDVFETHFYPPVEKRIKSQESGIKREMFIEIYPLLPTCWQQNQEPRIRSQEEKYSFRYPLLPPCWQ